MIRFFTFDFTAANVLSASFFRESNRDDNVVLNEMG